MFVLSGSSIKNFNKDNLADRFRKKFVVFLIYIFFYFVEL